MNNRYIAKQINSVALLLLLSTVTFNIFQPKIYAGQYQDLTVSDVEKFIDNTATQYNWKALKSLTKVNPRTGKILQITYTADLRKNEYISASLDYKSKGNSIIKYTDVCTKKIMYRMEYKKLEGKLVPTRSNKRMDNTDYKVYCKFYNSTQKIRL
jgi:hypothetical protein